MRVEVPLSPQTRSVYLQQLRDYPDSSCQPTIDPQRTLAIFDLPLKDVYRCGITRIINNINVSTQLLTQYPSNFHILPIILPHYLFYILRQIATIILRH